MEQSKREKLEAAGWKVGNADDFLCYPKGFKGLLSTNQSFEIADTITFHDGRNYTVIAVEDGGVLLDRPLELPVSREPSFVKKYVPRFMLTVEGASVLLQQSEDPATGEVGQAD